MTADQVPAVPSVRRVGWELLAASFVVLFQELALIRWLPVEVRVAGYFPNLILIGAFLGLGIGALRGKSASLLWVWPVSLVGIVGLAWAMSGIAFTANDVSEHLWLLYADLPEDAPVVNAIQLPLVLMFAVTALSFVPLGQFVGQRLELFRARSASLRGYALDLGGSVLGVAGFTIVSWIGLNPVFWFAPPLAVGLLLFGGSPRLRALHLGCAAVVLAVVFFTLGGKRFSPYYALETVPLVGDPGHEIRANGSLHQIAMDLVDERGSRRRLTLMLGYRHPYVQLDRPIRKALVLGAGSGNDVATLIVMGAEEIHAVEIDPEIIQIGRDIHPNDPYSDPRVTVHNTDARSFLNDSEEQFDLIVLGTLDSMTRLSAMSHVRLDNFVYTREALAAAAEHLTADGGLVLYFMIGQEFIYGHLFAMLAHTFGTPPAVHVGDYSLFNTVFMSGPGYAVEQQEVDADAWYLQDDLVESATPGDDWPYLYLPERGINSFYLSMILILAGGCIIAILSVSPEMRRSLLAGGRGVDWEMFLYGFAFLLVETRFVTAMNLLWGATWLTSAVVFGSILLVVLAGTLLMDRKPIRWQVAGVGLVLALLFTYAVPLRLLLSTSLGVRLALSMLLVGTPILFASLCFAVRFKDRPAADLAFGWNLLRAVLGGLAEFLSMTTGLSALALVAISAYVVAFIVAGRSSRGLPSPPAWPPGAAS